MSKCVAVCNQKGGVGKTTTAVNLSSSIALSGKRVLLIDIDPQGNATSGLGISKNDLHKSIYHAMLEQFSLNEAVIKTEIENLMLIPSNIDLTGAEVELVGVMGREFRLKNILQPVKNEYEYIFIDAPPSLGLLTVNAMVASDSIMIPLQCEYYSLEGLGQLLKTIDLIKRNINHTIEIEGIILTMADYRTKLTNEVIQEVRSHFKEKVYQTVIPRSVKIGESPGFGKPVVLYDKDSIGAKKYLELTEEFLANDTKCNTAPPVAITQNESA